jgi:hypothetical protein
LFPPAKTEGWIYVITDVDGMQAFWLTYDSGLTFLDGAEAAQVDGIGVEQIIPIVSAKTELSILGLQTTSPSLAVTIRLFGPDGQLASVIRNLPPAGAFRGKLSELFPSTDLTQARYVEISSPAEAVASSALIRGFQVPDEAAVVNGSNVTLTNEIVFPHMVNGELQQPSGLLTSRMQPRPSRSHSAAVKVIPLSSLASCRASVH